MLSQQCFLVSSLNAQYLEKVLKEAINLLVLLSIAYSLPLGQAFIRPRSHYAGEIWKPMQLSVRSTVYTNPSRMQSFENALRSREIWKRRLSVSVLTENILGTGFSKTMASWYHVISLTLKQFYRGRLLHFQISMALCGQETFIALSAWKRC